MSLSLNNKAHLTALVTTVFLVSFFLALLIAWHFDTQAPSHIWTIEEIMTRLVAFPALITALVVTWALFGASNVAIATPQGLSVEAVSLAPFKAQVVGVQWMNPLVRRDYPTEWQLLWTQGLAKPNKRDDMVRTDPASFSTIKPVAAIVWNINSRVTFSRFFGGYVDEILRPFGNRYVMNADYFYTIQPIPLHTIHP